MACPALADVAEPMTVLCIVALQEASQYVTKKNAISVFND
jgi:hypothetical protein